MFNTNAIEVVPGPATISDEWMLHLPASIRESFVNAKVRSSLSQLDNSTPLTQDLASLYLDVSDATLKRMRANNTGPAYVQGQPEDGGKSRNQKVIYTVGALKDWIESNKTTSTGHATIRRGLMFGTINDLLIPEPWWANKEGVLHQHGFAWFDIRLFYGTDGTDISNGADFEIVWLSVHDALTQRWLAPKERTQFDDIYADLLRQCLAMNGSAIEASFMEEALKLKKQSIIQNSTT